MTPDPGPPPQLPAAPSDPRAERLADLGRVWGAVRYLHPLLPERNLDWDAALLKAIPRVADAKNGEEEDAAVAEMLKALGDPATHLEKKGEEPAAGPPAPPGPPFRWTGKDVLIVDLGTFQLSRMFTLAGTLKPEIEKARALIVDLRPLPGMPSVGPYIDHVLDGVGDMLPSRDTVAPRQRWLVHKGYRPQQGITSGSYKTVFESSVPDFHPAAKGRRPGRILFLINERAILPPLALALQRNGDAQIIAAGTLTDEAAITQTSVPRRDRPAAAVRVTVLEGQVQADVSLPVDKGNRPANADGKDALLDAALALLDKPQPARRNAPEKAKAGAVEPQPAAWRRDAVYADEPYPSREKRLLALFRFWNVIHYFYPYLHLMGDTWDKALAAFVPRFEAAKDAREYGLAVSELSALIPDAHVRVHSEALDTVFGTSVLPAEVQRVEGKPVITDIPDPKLAEGLAVGDVVLSVDGEDFEARAARLGKYLAAANPWSHGFWTDYEAVCGPKGSTAVLVVEGAKGRKEVRVARLAPVPPQPGKDAREPFKMLDGGLGYVHLGRLFPQQIDAMFTALSGAKGIVFDMRGYPNRTAWAIAARLNTRGTDEAAMFLLPEVAGVEDDNRGTSYHLQGLPPAEGPIFRGPTVMLVDEQTQSQAEHTGLLFESANGTQFVGGATAGANGDITFTVLPGNVRVSFTGQEVRHADGRPLQRVGLSPLIPARPTIAGLRAGRDEVLERGIQVLREAIANQRK